MIRKLSLDIGLLCEMAEISKSGYYKYLKHVGEPEKDYEDYLIIKKIFDAGKGKYGWRTVQMKLKVKMNHKKIIRIKNKYNLITRIRRPNPYKNIMQKNQEHRTFENKLDRQFNQILPDKAFCTDITYLPFNGQLAYLSAVKDVASREITGWKASMNLQMDMVLKTLDCLREKVPSLQNILIHSDQGFHYTNPEFIACVKNLGMIQSMSRKGNCIDNAPMESFFGHLKDEVDYKKCQTFEELNLLLAEYMKYYNNERSQWGLKKMPPVEYRNHLLVREGV